MRKIKFRHCVIAVLIGLIVPLLHGAESLDSSFGQGAGFVTTAFGSGVQYNAVQIQAADGKIVAAGYTQNSNQQAFVARYNTDGSLDTTFGAGGMVATNIGSSFSTTVINDLAIQSDGKIVVVGFNDDSGVTQAFVGRYTSSGILDGTFGSGGQALNIFGGEAAFFNGVTLQTDGSIVAVGGLDASSTQFGLVARFDSTGMPDGIFGGSGFVTVSTGFVMAFAAVTLDSSGNIVATGFTESGSSNNYAITARLTSTGSFDSSFGSGGTVQTQIGTNTTATCLAIDASGNIVIGGTITDDSGNADLGLLWYDSTGTLYNNVFTSISGSAQIQSLAMQSDGNIIGAGYATDDINFTLVARYTPSGVLDTTFGSGGILALNFGDGSQWQGLALQTLDGRAVIAGYTLNPASGQQDGLVARFNKNNSDVVEITSIADGAIIDTKIPVISGTSSAASASAQVTINGTIFTTVSTDGSGNWNAGVSPVLLVGSNIIKADLIVSGTIVVSDEIVFTVVDMFGEDAVFAYDTTTQSALTGTFGDITFSNNGQIGTWSHTLSSASFTCNKSGTYVINYIGTATAVASNASCLAALRLAKNGSPVAGSQIVNSLTLDILSTFNAGSTLLLNSSAIVVLAANDVITLQAAGSNAQLAPVAEGGTSGPSAAVVITRIA